MSSSVIYGNNITEKLESFNSGCCSNEIVKNKAVEFEPKLDSATEVEKFLFEDNLTTLFSAQTTK